MMTQKLISTRPFSVYAHHALKKPLFSFIVAVAFCALVGCAQLPERNELDIDLNLEDHVDYSLPIAWWDTFQQPQLTLLVEEALGQNFSVKASQARVTRASAVLEVEGSQRYPSVTGELTPRYRYDHDIRASDTFSSVALKASWEIDLWGKNQLSTDIAYFNLLSTQEEYTMNQQALAGNVARQWYLLHEQYKAQSLLKQQIVNTKKITTISEQRYRYAQESISAVWRQEQLLESLQSQYSQSAFQLHILEKQMNILLGRSPNTPVSWKYNESINVPSSNIDAFSSELLGLRPDVRQAWYDYMGQYYKIGVARAAELPNISLSGGLESDEITELFELWKLDLGVRVNMPIFSAGRLAAETEQAQTSAEIAFYQYTQTVLEAIQEVELNLIDIDSQSAVLESLNTQINHAEMILKVELIRYSSGIQSYLDVLDAQERLFSLQKQKLNAERQLLLTHISLHQSVAGDISIHPTNTSDKAV
ncbi:TolC family protein [Vibrio sp. FNV 38]|nr:TolC family protein [Vibrio sp. FNV 38]